MNVKMIGQRDSQGSIIISLDYWTARHLFGSGYQYEEDKEIEFTSAIQQAYVNDKIVKDIKNIKNSLENRI